MIGLAAGFVAALRLWPGRRGTLAVATSLVLAFGAASLIQYAWLVAGKPGLLGLVLLECAALAGALSIPRAGGRAPAPEGGERAPRPFRVLLAVASAAAAVAMLHTFRELPHGAWDAVDLWNARALGFARAGLDETLASARHPDYPLLLPLVISHAWAFVGPHDLVPRVVGVAFAAAGAAILYGATARLAGARAAAIATIVLLASPLWAFQAATQRADVALSCFALASVVALVLHERMRQPSLLLLAGALLGCALWTKNEGIFFATAASLVWLAGGRERLRSGWRIALGAAPFAAALVHHKLTCGATTDLIAGQGAPTLERLADASRWLATAAAFAREGAFYAIAGGALLVLLARERRGAAPPGARFVWITLGLVLAGDFAVYVLTPHDLAWHLASSLERVLVQAWPLALFAAASLGPGTAPAR
jgi:hypothetical protein